MLLNLVSMKFSLMVSRLGNGLLVVKYDPNLLP